VRGECTWASLLAITWTRALITCRAKCYRRPVFTSSFVAAILRPPQRRHRLQILFFITSTSATCRRRFADGSSSRRDPGNFYSRIEKLNSRELTSLIPELCNRSHGRSNSAQQCWQSVWKLAFYSVAAQVGWLSQNSTELVTSVNGLNMKTALWTPLLLPSSLLLATRKPSVEVTRPTFHPVTVKSDLRRWPSNSPIYCQNQWACQISGYRSFGSKVIVRKQTHTHTHTHTHTQNGLFYLYQ